MKLLLKSNNNKYKIEKKKGFAVESLFKMASSQYQNNTKWNRLKVFYPNLKFILLR